MLNKNQKLNLRHQPDFFSKSRKIFRPDLTFFYLLEPKEQSSSGNSSLPSPKTTIIVPKKNFRLATKRNALKRRIALLVKEKSPDWPSNLQLVIVPTKKFSLENSTNAHWPDFSSFSH